MSQITETTVFPLFQTLLENSQSSLLKEENIKEILELGSNAMPANTSLNSRQYVYYQELGAIWFSKIKNEVSSAPLANIINALSLARLDKTSTELQIAAARFALQTLESEYPENKKYDLSIEYITWGFIKVLAKKNLKQPEWAALLCDIQMYLDKQSDRGSSSGKAFCYLALAKLSNSNEDALNFCNRAESEMKNLDGEIYQTLISCYLFMMRKHLGQESNLEAEAFILGIDARLHGLIRQEMNFILHPDTQSGFNRNLIFSSLKNDTKCGIDYADFVSFFSNTVTDSFHINTEFENRSQQMLQLFNWFENGLKQGFP